MEINGWSHVVFNNALVKVFPRTVEGNINSNFTYRKKRKMRIKFYFHGSFRKSWLDPRNVF